MVPHLASGLACCFPQCTSALYDYPCPTALQWNKEDCCLRIALGNSGPAIYPPMKDEDEEENQKEGQRVPA